MKVGDHLCKLRHDRERQAPLLRHAVVELRLVEPAHDECPLNGVALASKAQSTAFGDNYRNHIEIKLTCGTSVDGKLVDERATPILERRKIEKRVFDGALDLVGVGSGQKNHGGVGFDAVHGKVARPIGLRRGHEVEHLRLIGIGLPHNANVAQSRGPLWPGVRLLQEPYRAPIYSVLHHFLRFS